METMAAHPTGPRPVVPEVTPAEAKARQDQGAVVVDVREAEEWQEGHVSGAVHIPLATLPQRLHQLDPQQEVITVCRGGNRSAFAADALLKAGFPRVSSMAGGTMAWTEQGLPVSK
jgi:rhodanese-related sulfurtransferase